MSQVPDDADAGTRDPPRTHTPHRRTIHNPDRGRNGIRQSGRKSNQ